MKLISAQEIQNMNEKDMHNLFNSLSENQARRKAEECRLKSVGNVSLKLSLYSEYSFD